jgi:hypothetical protein
MRSTVVGVAVGPAQEVVTSKINPPIDIPMQFSRWWQWGGRSWRASLDIVLAAVVGKAGAILPVVFACKPLEMCAFSSHLN